MPLDITKSPIAAKSLYFSGKANDNILLKSVFAWPRLTSEFMLLLHCCNNLCLHEGLLNKQNCLNNGLDDSNALKHLVLKFAATLSNISIDEINFKTLKLTGVITTKSIKNKQKHNKRQ